ncbi:hypothetical protein L7F22_065453 [Adiantum nelumboides]|nr:hypothetical protein [Adiantum nelumboides]
MIWYFDSGASRHITSRKDLFCSLDAAPAGKKVTCANNASYPIKGVGKILITISDGSYLCLPDVLYVPGIKKNLLSVSSLVKNGLRVIFEDDRCIVRDRENGYSLITTGTLENGLFVLDRYEKQIQACIAETKTQAMQDAELWHARFGHVGYGSLMTLQRHNMVHDLSLLEMPPRHVCEGCVLGKMHRFAFSQDGSVRATRKLQLVHSDVCGPMRTPSVGNSLYFVTFIDDFSRFCWVYPLKAKSHVFAIFQHYVSMVENETGCKVQTLRTDRGGEYMSGAFKDFLGKKGIKHQCTMPYTPQQNGVAERKNSIGSKGYRLYSPATNKIFESRDVIFAETTAQPMVAFDVPHMQTQDLFEGFLPSFVENQESQQVDNFDQSFDQHVTPHDVEEIVREEQEVLREEQTLPKWVQKTLQDSKLDAPLPRKTRADKEQDSYESAQEDIQKEVEAVGPSEYERSDEEDTSTPLEKRSQKPRSREQVLMDEAMARVEAKRKELADARAAKAIKTARPMTMEEAKKIRIEKAKAIQKERRRIGAEKKAQEEAEAAQAAQTQQKEVVAKETDVQKDRANKAHDEIINLKTALELVTQERDTNARENENLLRDLIDLQSQLTKKEDQNHELIKNEKKMKEQLKYEDARFQKLTASYNTVKTTLTATTKSRPAAATPSISASATTNTLAALQEELQTEKLQRQRLVSGFKTQTVQHEAKVKQLELELAQAKVDLEAVGSLASTSQIHQAETHLQFQQPLMLEVPKFQRPEEEEQPRPAPGALDIREQMEQDVEDMPEGPAKEYLLYEKKVMESVALAFLQPDEQIKDYGNDFLPLPLMRHETNLWKEKMRPAMPRNEEGGYEGIPLTSEEAQTLIEDHPRWRKKWLS